MKSLPVVKSVFCSFRVASIGAMSVGLDELRGRKAILPSAGVLSTWEAAAAGTHLFDGGARFGPRSGSEES